MWRLDSAGRATPETPDEDSGPALGVMIHTPLLGLEFSFSWPVLVLGAVAIYVISQINWW